MVNLVLCHAMEGQSRGGNLEEVPRSVSSLLTTQLELIGFVWIDLDVHRIASLLKGGARLVLDLMSVVGSFLDGGDGPLAQGEEVLEGRHGQQQSIDLARYSRRKLDY